MGSRDSTRCGSACAHASQTSAIDVITRRPSALRVTNNRTQAVRLPANTRFPDGVKKVNVRVVGQERIIAPANTAWDSFFLGTRTATDDEGRAVDHRELRVQSSAEQF